MKILLLAVCVFTTSLGFTQEWFDGKCQLNTAISEEQYKSEKIRNLLTIIIAQDNTLIINDEPYKQLSEIKFKELILNFIDNPKQKNRLAESPKKAIIAMRAFGNKDRYKLLENYIREVYLYVWNVTAKKEFNKAFAELNCNKRERIFSKFYPYNLYKITEGKQNKNRFPSSTPGPPPFPSDVKDN